MNPNLRAFAILAAMLALSGQPSPKPVEAAPAYRSPDEAALNSALSRATAENESLKAQIAQLQDELAQAKSAPPYVPPQPIAATSTSVASGGVVCASGSCGQGVRYARQERYYSGQRFASRTRFFDGDGRPFRKAR